jgi:hypothetical protein
MGIMRKLGSEGDVKIEWNPENTEEVAKAREIFEKALKDKFAAFRVDVAGGKGQRITEFDPEAEKIILTPPMAGG